MQQKTYSIGAVNVRKYTELLVRGCAICFLSGAVIATITTSVIFGFIFKNVTNGYEEEIRVKNTMLAEIENAHEEELIKQEAYQKQLRATVSNENLELQDRIMELESEVLELTQTLMEPHGEGTDDFNLIKEYWYVLRDAPTNSGLSLDTIRYLDEVCKEWDVNPHWMWAIYTVESDLRTNVDSSKSTARGIGQVLEGTAREIWIKVLGHDSYNHTMAYDPYVNMEITTCLIGRNLAKGSMENAINLYGDQTDSYYGKVIAAGKAHGITLTEDNAHYPQLNRN